MSTLTVTIGYGGIPMVRITKSESDTVGYLFDDCVTMTCPKCTTKEEKTYASRITRAKAREFRDICVDCGAVLADLEV